MQRSYHLFLALALLVSFDTGTAQAADDLVSIYEGARSSDPIFQQAIADRQAREEALPQAQGGVLPSLSIDSSYSAIDTDSNLGGTGNITDDYRQLTYGVSLTQSLYRYARVHGIDRAQAQVEQARADFSFAEQSLILRVAERYFAVLDEREAVKAAQASLEAIQRQLEQARQRFEVGVIARTDVEEAKAQADLARAELLQTQDDLENERERLRELIDRTPNTLFRVRDQVELATPDPANPDEWRNQAQSQNRQLLAARFAAEAAMQTVEVERGARFPTFDLVAGYDKTEQYDRLASDRDGDELSATVQFNLPLYQGGQISSNIRQAQYRYTEARAALEEVRRTVTRNAATAYRGVVTAKQRVSALDQARISTQAALDATEAGFEVGTRTIVDVLDAQQEVFNAQRDYAQARHAYLINTLRLQQSAGSLSVEDLNRVNALLASD